MAGPSFRGTNLMYMNDTYSYRWSSSKYEVLYLQMHKAFKPILAVLPIHTYVEGGRHSRSILRAISTKYWKMT